MPQNLIVTDSIDPEKWVDFVYNHPHGNIFQTPEMQEVYERTKNYDPITLAAVDGGGEILALVQAVVIREMGGYPGTFSTRSVIQGGPLYVGGNEGKEAVRMLMGHYNGIARKKALYTQIRNMWDTSEIFDILKTVGYRSEEHLNFFNRS